MTQSQIISFSFDSDMESLKVTTHGKFGRTEHTYYSVPKSVLLKLLNRKEAPTLQDIDGWMQDYRDKEDKKYKNAGLQCEIYSFWKEDD